LPLPLMGGSVVPYAMAAGGCALGAMLGLTVHMPLYYEAVYHLTASESGLALIPLAAVSTGGAAIAGKAMARMKHYKRVAIIGTAFSASIAAVLAVATPLPLWALLVLLSLFALGLGTTFPISVVSIQNSVHRSQVGTVTGALNFFRALAASFTVAAFTAILLMALGADIALGEGRGAVNAIAAADMVTAFRYVFGAAAAMMAGATLLMLLMEEKPLAGPASVPAEMAE
jgi:MFS family permease